MSSDGPFMNPAVENLMSAWNPRWVTTARSLWEMFETYPALLAQVYGYFYVDQDAGLPNQLRACLAPRMEPAAFQEIFEVTFSFYEVSSSAAAIRVD